MNFEDYLCEQNEILDSLVYELLCTMVSPGADADEDVLPWSQEFIAPIVDYAATVLETDVGISPCHPYYECEYDEEEEHPCYMGKNCSNKNCPFKNKEISNENTAL